MKKLLSILLSSVAPWVLITGCTTETAEGDVIYEGQKSTPPEITIRMADTPNATTADFNFIPNETTATFEIALGSEDDHERFAAGDLPTETFTATETLLHRFEGLTENTFYTVYAKAYDESGEISTISSYVFQTFFGDFSLEVQFVGPTSAAAYIHMSYDYTVYLCGLATDLDEPEFFLTSTGNLVSEPVFATTTLTYFDLEPGTQYYFIYRAQDRFGEWTKIFVEPVTTPLLDEGPDVEFIVNHTDVWYTSFTFKPNGNVTEYGFYAIGGGYDFPILVTAPAGYSGDVLRYMDDMHESFQTTASREEYNYNPVIYQREPDYEILILIVMYDDDLNPICVTRHFVSTPELDESIGTAVVDVEITPTTTGAVYTFKPNDETLGFFGLTFNADWLDARGWTDEQIITSFLYSSLYGSYFNNSTQWWHRYHPDRWELTWEDDTAGDSDQRLYVVTVPMNANGVHGWGDITKKEYNKL